MLKVVGASWLQTKISSYVLGALGILAILALFVGEIERIQDDGNYAATVYWSKKTGYHIEFWGQGNDLSTVSRGVARAYYRADIDTTGWSQLEIETDGSYSDEVQAYAAGLLEGALTWQLVHWQWRNVVEAPCLAQPRACKQLREALEESSAAVRLTASTHQQTEPFWHQVSLYYKQIDGIYSGWKHGVKRSRNEHEMDPIDFLWLNMASDLPHLQKALKIKFSENNEEETPGTAAAYVRLLREAVEVEGAKVEREKLIVAHNSAGSYNSMLRIMKRYELNYHQTSAPESALVLGTTSVFPGYPGALTSQDHLYIISGTDSSNHRMMVTGTQINNFNDDLWKKVNIVDQVPIGPRVSAANRLSSSGRAWGSVLRRVNSGSAAAQWLVLDLARLNDGVLPGTHTIARGAHKQEVVIEVMSAPEQGEMDVKHTEVHRVFAGADVERNTGLLWLVEQVPGLTHAGDMTRALRDAGYFATYGLPMYKDIINATHTSKMQKKYGNVFSPTESPRKLVFEKISKYAVDNRTIMQLMRSHNLSEIINNNADDGVRTEGNEIPEVKCSDGTYVKKSLNCLFKDNFSLGERGDLHGNNKAYGVIDTKVVTAIKTGVVDFKAVSGPTFTRLSAPVQANTSDEGATPTSKRFTDRQLNKGNIATVMEKRHIEAHREDTLQDSIITLEDSKVTLDDSEYTLHGSNAILQEMINKDEILPFQWSKSQFSDIPHEGHPDLWEFQPVNPTWVW